MDSTNFTLRKSVTPTVQAWPRSALSNRDTHQHHHPLSTLALEGKVPEGKAAAPPRAPTECGSSITGGSGTTGSEQHGALRAEASQAFARAKDALSQMKLSVEEEDLARREKIQSISDKIMYSRSTQQMHGIQSAASSTNDDMRLALEAFVRDDMTSAVRCLIEALDPDVDLSRSDTLMQCVAQCLDYFEQEVGTHVSALCGLWRLKNGDEREPTAEELKIVYDSILGVASGAMDAA